MGSQVIDLKLLYEMVGSLLYENNVLRLRIAELEGEQEEDDDRD